MKYVVVLGDGMADEPVAEIGNKTPLDVANKPMIDSLAQKGEVGLVQTIPEGMSPGSDTANLSVMGYSPIKYYTGRSPLEAISMGIDMKDTDVCFRCNLVTVSDDEINYEDKRIIDHSSGEISSEEARVLIEAVEEAFGNDTIKYYPGVSYRHALVWENGSTDVELEPPHNILERRLGDYLPKGEHSDEILSMMKKSYDILKNHEINIKRREQGLNEANSIWIWGEGTRPTLPAFEEKFGLKGSMISAVDLLKGIAIAADMNSIDVEGATGNIHTNYEGKVKACLDALENGYDFVYVHIEAPDECGHQGQVHDKTRSIELLDERVVAPIVEKLKADGEDFKIMVLPDHATPVAIRTHTSDPIPYMIYDSSCERDNPFTYTEEQAKKTNKLIEEGHSLMGYFLQG